MSEQPKKKGLSTSIIFCIICAGILVAATALAIRSVVKTQQENESRQQSMVAASESMLAASNDEETRLLNAVTDVCKSTILRRMSSSIRMFTSPTAVSTALKSRPKTR